MHFQMNDGTVVKAEEKLLWWQAKGLSYTATGYGKAIPTRWMVKVNGRTHRVYCSIWGNIGTCYIKRKGYTFDQNIVG
jgi:hypothetical protein